MATALNVDWSDVAARASTLVERLDGLVELRRTAPALEARRLGRWCELVARGDRERFAARLALDGLDAERAALLVGEASWKHGTPLPVWTSLVADALARDPEVDDRCLPPPGDEVVPFQEALVPFVRAASDRLGDRSEASADSALASLERSLLAHALGRSLDGARARVQGLAAIEDPALRGGAPARDGPPRTRAVRHVGARAPRRRAPPDPPPLPRPRTLARAGGARVDAGDRRAPRQDRRRPPPPRGDVRGRPAGRAARRCERPARLRPASRPAAGRPLRVRVRAAARLQAEAAPRRGRLRRARRLVLGAHPGDRAEAPARPRLRRPRLGRARGPRGGLGSRRGSALLPPRRRAAGAAPRRRRDRLPPRERRRVRRPAGRRRLGDRPLPGVRRPGAGRGRRARAGARRPPRRVGARGGPAAPLALRSVRCSGRRRARRRRPRRPGRAACLGAPEHRRRPAHAERGRAEVGRRLRGPGGRTPARRELRGGRRRRVPRRLRGAADPRRRAGRAGRAAGLPPRCAPPGRPARNALVRARPTALPRSGRDARRRRPRHRARGARPTDPRPARARRALAGPPPRATAARRGRHPRLRGGRSRLGADGGRRPAAPLPRFRTRTSRGPPRHALAHRRAMAARARPRGDRHDPAGELPSAGDSPRWRGIRSLGRGRRADRGGLRGDRGAHRPPRDLAGDAPARRGRALDARRDERRAVRRDDRRRRLPRGARGDDRWCRLARAALERTLSEAARRPRRLAATGGLGGASGAGGIVLGLALCGRLLGDERPVEAARAVAGSLSPDDFEHDDRLDLLGGSAGALAGLLALPDPPGELAAAAARRLAAHAVDGRTGPGWPTVGGRALDGFSHGTAGIALVLARYALAAGDESLLRLAHDAIRGESERFDADLGGWRDRRRDEPAVGPGWCHGAAGIALSRLELLRLAPGGELEELARRDLERALPAVTAAAPLDHLCCGAAGEADVLLEVAHVTGDARCLERASRFCDELAGRVLGGDGPGLAAPATGAAAIPVPGLYQGTSGVGLVLLRAAHPELPSVLRWA